MKDTNKPAGNITHAILLADCDRPFMVDMDAIDRQSETSEVKQLDEIGSAILNAGYTGIRMLEAELSNGRFFHVWQADCDTPEGRLFEFLVACPAIAIKLPVSEVMKIIARVYREQAEAGKP